MTTNCPFCPFNDPRRIVAEDDRFWLVATLGQILEGYTLLIPKRHVPCLGAMNAEETNGLAHWVDAAADATELEYGVRPVLSEHGIVGQSVPHAHLHLLPAELYLANRVESDFPPSETAGLRSFHDLRSSYSERQQPYLFSQSSDGRMHVCWDPQSEDPADLKMYFRVVAAEMLGLPDRANWRDMDPQLDEELYLATTARLRPYFEG